MYGIRRVGCEDLGFLWSSFASTSFGFVQRCGLHELAREVAGKPKNDYRDDGSNSFVLPQEEADTEMPYAGLGPACDLPVSKMQSSR